MKNRLILAAPTLAFAVIVLLVSIFRTTSVRLVLAQSPSIDIDDSNVHFEIDYILPESLEVYPDDMLWKVKAFEDKILLESTLDKVKRSKVMRSHSDERLVAATELLRNSDVSLGISYLIKSEDYLYDSLFEIDETNTTESRQEFKNIALASLKHRLMLEKLLDISPGEIKPEISKVLDKSKLTYKEARVLIELFGDTAPRNVFDEK